MSLTEKIRKKIISFPDSAIFMARDFLEYGSRESIRHALKRLAAKGFIRRILPGIYDFPKFRPILNSYSPPAFQDLPDAIARKFHWTIVPEGNAVLNRLGIDTQVPAKCVYNSSGPSRIFRIGKAVLEFRHVAPSFLKATHMITKMIMQIMLLPEKHFMPDRRAYLSSRLTEDDRLNLKDDLENIPGKYRARMLEVIG